MAKRSKSGRRQSASSDEPLASEIISPTEVVNHADSADSAASQVVNASANVIAAPATRELAGEPPSSAYEPAQPDVIAAPFASNENDPEEDAGATRESIAIPAPPPPVSAQMDEPGATVVRERPAALDSSEEETIQAPTVQGSAPRPRYNTLAGAFSRPRTLEPEPEPQADLLAGASAPEPLFEAGEDLPEIADEVDPETEWSVADQPTVQLSPDELGALRPSFLETGEQPSWPPRPAEASASTDQRPQAPTRPRDEPPSAVEPDPRDWRSGLPPRPRPPFPLGGVSRPLTPSERLAAPDGRPAQPSPPEGPDPDYRMERLQELRRHRTAHEQGEEATGDPTPVADAVRQWWHDLRPGVGNALQYQREARESGSHPLPAYAPPPSGSRLGDAFGRFAASARGVTERAQQVAGPAFKRIHDQMEHAAQGFIQRFEGRQQAPFLGPGRVAVFFRRGVTVGQAQRLLAASSARPMRLIPRKHGILAQVMPGRESEVGERLRQHPYVDDVVYMEYGERP